MNKQEAIEKLKSRVKSHWLDEEIYGDNCIKSVELGMAIDIVNQIDEPEKPVLPQFVADWIEWCKRNKVSLLGAISPIDELGTAICDDKKVESLEASKWATRNQETFAQAWLFGYKVDKEKLYTVELPNPNGFIRLVLCKDCDGKLFVETFLIDEWETFGKCKLTEAEIKKEFSWTWQFAKELEDKDQEEKLYTVEFPNPNSDNHLVLRKNFDGKVCVSLLHSEYWRGNESTRLTEAEIKECFNWAWQFAKEVEND